ncbi:MAG: gamma subclass chorismate mutase AroQ [Povalibacter sp.]
MRSKLLRRIFSLVLLFCFAGAHSVPADPLYFSDPQDDVRALIDLMAQRLALMPDVAAWKYANNKPVTDAVREAQVLSATIAQAQALGIYAASARGLFELQIQLASRIQEQAIAQWRATQTHPSVVRDLQQELRPELDRIGKQLLVQIYLALPELQRADFPDRFGSQAKALRRDSDASFLTDEDARALIAKLAQVRRSGAPSLDQIRTSGVLRVGTTGDYAPFSADTQGQLTGADIALAVSLAQTLGVRVRFVRTSWPTLMQDYRENDFDIAMSGISVTDDRSREASFSVPYHQGGKTPIVRCGTEARFDTLAEIDRPKTRVIVNPGGTNEAFAREHFTHAQLRVHPDNRTIFQEIAQDRADVMITDDLEVDLQTHRLKQLCRATTDTFTHSDKAMLLSKDPLLKQSVDAWLKTQLDSGEVRRAIDTAMRDPAP